MSNATGIDTLTERIGGFLHLGERIKDLHDATDEKDVFHSRNKEDPETLKQCIDQKTREYQRLIIECKYCKPLKRALTFRTQRKPDSIKVQLLALVAYLDSTDIYSRHNLDACALIASCLFPGDNQSTRMTRARFVIGRMIQNKVLELDCNILTVSGQLRYWLGVNNCYAQPHIDEKEIERYFRPDDKKHKDVVEGFHKFRAKKISEKIPDLNPREISDMLENDYGYKGQENVRKQMAVICFNHLQRVRKMMLDVESPENIGPAERVLVMGPSGCGKTYMVDCLTDLMGIKFAKTDCTSLSETGYVGGSVEQAIYDLYEQNQKNLPATMSSGIYLDEVDKLAHAETGANIFGGQGTTMQVSRSGVQRSLLQMLGNGEYPIYKGRKEKRALISTKNILIIASGAFLGLNSENKKSSIGFSDLNEVNDDIENEDISQKIVKFGIARELMGRFTHVIQMQSLNVPELKAIFKRNTLNRFSNELQMHGIQLRVDDEVIKLVAQRAHDSGFGARGLVSKISLLDDAKYEAYSSPTPVKSIALFLNSNGSLDWDIEYKHRTKIHSENQNLKEIEACQVAPLTAL